jgi:glycosyltransferase involved in cell wall biosynthesis
MKGNNLSFSTYSYANKPIFRIPTSVHSVYAWPGGKNFDSCRNHFLWFGGPGLVHKGLDLVLDAFRDLPDYHLTVCGPIDEEKDFESVYYKELFETPNIHSVGWVDVLSPEFIEIANNCIGIIFPSCSECGGAGVIVCMHAGLIPIVSYESSIETYDFGVTLKNCSIDTIEDAIQMVSSLPKEELELRARKAWEYARANHTRERFAEEYRKIIEKIISLETLTG